MPLTRLDHVNVRTSNLAAMVDWYRDVLGMAEGWRPQFPFPGAWMYLGDHPCVHLVGTSGEPGAGSEGDLKLEHFAFQASGMAEFEARLHANGVRYERRDVPGTSLRQYNVWDPDGNHIHIDFDTAKE